MKQPMMLAAALLLMAAAPAERSITIPVDVAPSLGDHQSGRLIVFVTPAKKGDKPQDEIDFSPFSPTEASIAARDVADLRTGEVARIDGDSDTYPTRFSALPPGTYRMQAVLDRNHDYNYGGRGEGDLVSRVMTVRLPGRVPVIRLDRTLPAPDEAAMVANRPEPARSRLATYLPKVEPLEVPSAAMTRFRGTPTAVRGWIALPPGYDGKTRFPTVYSDGGFGSTLTSARTSAASIMAQMAEGSLPPMIWVYLDHSGPTGTHEFADSLNNGPWGEALTEEVIPALEKRYRMDAKSQGRFLTGHSSGGWSTLWLQVRYPKVFGGSWPTAPDPSDFHDFTGVDIYAPNANAYVRPDGTPTPLVRDKGKVIATFEQFARSEAVLGSYGGQLASFDWVFSPRGADGKPLPMFDRATGKVDPVVAAYWRENYDIAHIVARDWPKLKDDLDGKIHLIVGTADTFYLDGAARRLQTVLDGLGAKSSFRFIDGKTHFDLFKRGDDPHALMKDITWEMMAIARPGLKRPG